MAPKLSLEARMTIIELLRRAVADGDRRVAESFNGRFRDECLDQHWFTSSWALPSSCFTVCLTNSSDGSTRAWNRSGWATGETPSWQHFSVSMRIRSFVVSSTCSIRMSLAGYHWRSSA